MLQDAGLLRGLVGALVRQRDSRAFTAAARALFPVRNQPPVPDTTVPWPAPRSEGAHPRPCHTPPALCVPPVCTQSTIISKKNGSRANTPSVTLHALYKLCTSASLTPAGITDQILALTPLVTLLTHIMLQGPDSPDRAGQTARPWPPPSPWISV